MKVSEIKIALEEEVDDTIALSKHLRWLNDGYRKVIARIKKVNSSLFLENTTFDLTANNGNEIEITLPDDLATIDRVDYVDSNSISTKPIRIKNTVFDEKKYITGLRWFRKGNKIIFRGLDEGIANVKLHYWTKITKLNYEEGVSDDEINLPDPAYDSILVTYELFRYFKSENMETDGKQYLDEFYLELDEMISDLTPVSEPMKLKVGIENGID